jgi:RimJ/RimL family protein N-acetyltransferase
MIEHFTTARLIARDWTAADLEAAFAIYGRDEVTRWLGPQPRQPVPEAGRDAIALAFGLDKVGPDQVWPVLASQPARPVLDSVVALADPDNIRSRQVCQCLGMRHRGQTSEYYGLTLELFELTRAEAA